MVPRGEDRDEISDEAKRLCGGCHVAGEVRTEAGIFVGLEIGEVDDGGRRDGRRDEVRDESYEEIMLPEEAERDDCGDDVRRELCRVDLVKEDFSLSLIVRL